MAGQDGFVDADAAYVMLTHAAQSYDNLQYFRDLWLDALNGSGVQPQPDKRILRDLAERLATGALRVARKSRPDPGPPRRGGGGGAPPPPVADVPKPTPPGPPPLKLRAPTLPPQVTKTLASAMDVAKQAECLLNAAKDGLPFVEQSVRP